MMKRPIGCDATMYGTLPDRRHMAAMTNVTRGTAIFALEYDPVFQSWELKEDIYANSY